jgi:hypothetical protein
MQAYPIPNSSPDSFYAPSCLLVEPTADQLAQLVFLGELFTQDLKLSDQRSTALNDGFLGGLLAIGLNSELDFCEERMGNLIVSKASFRVVYRSQPTLITSK